MKLRKSLFMLCAAGLSLCACNSDDKLQVPEGPGMVEVKIINPSTRAELETITVQGSITVTLYYDGDKYLSQTVAAGSNTPVRFWNITDPIKVTASLNDGIENYSQVLINSDGTGEGVTGGNLQAEPANIPAYGETPFARFRLVGTMSPTGEEDENSGYTENDKNKTFQKYAAIVQMAIPVARLEVGQLSHENHGSEECVFSTLSLKGVYLDKLASKGGTYDSNTNRFSYASSDQNEGVGFNEALLSSNKGADAIDFKTTSYSETSFNFYATENNPPIFKVYFSQAYFADGDVNQTREGWAMITRYKIASTTDPTGYEDVKFENGVIYRISEVSLTDENIVGDEENDAVYGVEVTVERAKWSIQPIKADWAN